MSIIGAFMVPHPPIILAEVGHGEEKKIQATIDAYRQVAREIAALKPETIVISDPHNVMYYDYFNISGGHGDAGSFADFRAPQVRFVVRYDTAFVDTVSRAAAAENFPAGTLGTRQGLDHGFMIPLYFLQQEGYTDFETVRVGLSGLPYEKHYQLGQMIRDTAEKLHRRTVFIASGDLSHRTREEGPYGFAPEGPEYDRRIMDVMENARFGELFDFDEIFCEKAAECGHRSFLIMAGALDRTAVEPEALSHEDIFGVGYGICTFHPVGPDPSRNFLDQWQEKEDLRLQRRREAEDAYVRLARQTIETWVLDKKKTDRASMGKTGLLPDEMLQDQAGAFVSIHESGRLRGCIGTISPVRRCIAEEIIENAISAATRDPRFPEIRPDELPLLEISVDILGEPEPIHSMTELDPSIYGVIVSKGDRRGLLLPALDGVDTPEEQVRIAREKANIGRAETGITLERFRVTRHEPELPE